MSTVSDPADAGQNTNPSTATPDPLTEILTAIRKLTVRIDAMEQRFEYLDRDVLHVLGEHERANAHEVEPLTEPSPGPVPPPLALLSDGRIALSTLDLEGIDLSARERFTGIVLTEDEASDVLDYLASGLADAAARMAGGCAGA